MTDINSGFIRCSCAKRTFARVSKLSVFRLPRLHCGTGRHSVGIRIRARAPPGYLLRRPQPGINVSELLAILKITKQSLSRVLGQLVRESFIEQREGTRDRRQRLLELTKKGVELERRLSESQRQRFADAYRDAGAESVQGFRDVLTNMISKEDRDRVLGPRKIG